VTTATYTYDNAGQLTSDGTTTYTYDAAGNMTAAGTDSFTWDWNSRMTSATVGGTTESFAYDGNDVRVSTTLGGTTTSYVWDRPANGSPRTGCSCDRENGAPLPLLVSDGTKQYLHADGLLAEVDAANAATYPLSDVLGSVRGLTNGSGTVTGSASYDVFGAIRGQTGATSGFGFTGEQRDGTTGFTYLRARYHNPALGRFVSQDTVQPNAPGTQGWNLYAYVANNPMTWADPSGHYGNTPGFGFLDCMERAAFALATGVALLALAERVVNPVFTAAIALAAMPFFALGIFTAIACVVELLWTVALALKGVISDALQVNSNAPGSANDLARAPSQWP
jgi:RHS repeat-associated protein